MTIEFLTHNFFEIRNQAHLWHFQTESYPEHKALGSFYEKWTDLTDNFIETYAGRYGRPSAGFNCSALPYQEGTVHPYILKIALFLKSGEVRNVAPDTDLQNILDELTALANHTAYLLTLK